ncbi:MAG: rod-binding protein [Gemmatimonadaceae bacterium]
MTTPPAPGAAAVPPVRALDRLAAGTGALDGMFARQLFAAMRETVPEGGLTGGGAGEEMFTAMLHEHVADALPAQWERRRA